MSNLDGVGRSVTFQRQAFVSCALLFATVLGNSCGPSVSLGDVVSPSAAPLKTFEPGGTIDVSALGITTSVKITECFYNNTDAGNADDIEINGSGLTLHFKNEAKLPDKAGDTDFSSLIGKRLPVWIEPDEPLSITIPGQDKYPVLDGALTLDRFENGMDGRDWWEGRLDLTIQTVQGNIPVSGALKTCIIPVW